MKRLLLKNNSELKSFSLSYSPEALVYNNDGSYISADGHHCEIGICIACTKKYCIEISEDELETDLFNSFPHNTSRRVCPTKAISFDKSIGSAIINADLCIACGLCVHRCPTAAIQFDFTKNSCYINTEGESKIPCKTDYQETFIESINTIPHQVHYNHIPVSFGEKYQSDITHYSGKNPDICEIIIRNTLINMGIPCNVTATGNNHIRVEFFGRQGSYIIIGESTNSKESEILTVLRRILDDEAVMIGRYGAKKETIIPLAVLNGLPNKRTDYYEEVNDIKQVLDIQVNTITFYVLFLLNLFNIKMNIVDFGSFIINKDLQDLEPYVENYINNIRTIDKNIGSSNYTPVK